MSAEFSSTNNPRKLAPYIYITCELSRCISFQYITSHGTQWFKFPLIIIAQLIFMTIIYIYIYINKLYS